jgi:hypothetical protein
MKKNKRYLVYDTESMGWTIGDPELVEVKCLEISKKGMVKLLYPISGMTQWERQGRFNIFETLA